MKPRCLRVAAGLPRCPLEWPSQPVHWCPTCRAAAAKLGDELLARFLETCEPSGPEPPCPLDAHQAEAYADWLAAAGDRPAWSLRQLNDPSPN